MKILHDEADMGGAEGVTPAGGEGGIDEVFGIFAR